MVTALDEYFPFASGPGSNVTELQWRRLMGNAPAGRTGIVRGVQSEFRVIQRAAGANMSVDVGAGEARILGHVGYDDDTTNVGISSNPSGNPRIDTIVLRADFVNDLIEMDVLVGTPAVSPAAPALTQNTSLWEIPLANVAVAAGAASIVTANITDRRAWANAIPWQRTWTIAGVLAVPSSGVNYINPVPLVVPDGWTGKIAAARYRIRGGTSATAKVQQSSTFTGALSDVTGLTALSATTTPTKTALVAGSTEVTITDENYLAVVLTAISASPDNLSFDVQGWLWPTPLVP